MAIRLIKQRKGEGAYTEYEDLHQNSFELKRGTSAGQIGVTVKMYFGDTRTNRDEARRDAKRQFKNLCNSADRGFREVGPIKGDNI